MTFFSAGLFFETALTFVAFVAATIVDYPLGRSGRNAGSLPWKAFGYPAATSRRGRPRAPGTTSDAPNR
ncbi:hypothetical protein CBM2592_B110017 [Cupriavidus taiwanensis]|nr:hypothetical protein CBM2592_B110017 [Cupriavidus taiwanensis]SOY98455.1 hypothetical protein CBM2591_B90017 [Cupriavidus taiwanensis]SOZ26936.1 hypothetical protein CBM2608_B100009 [Cupriavidus taiwanensis]SOZ77314.1 hypothetical protein CBM2617_U10084 [Cupriavidus taiwanensis]SOZ85328.1 hypothetical protein CBM2618_B130104 [Cupriavidus taiwanensis]